MNGPWVHITVEYTTSTANFCPFSLSNSFLRACMTRQHVSRKKAARKLLRFESLAVAWLFSLRVTHVDNWPINCLVSQNKNLSSRGHSGFLRVIACDKTWFRPYWGSSAWHSHQSVAGENPCIKTLSCWSESFKSLHTTHVGAFGWEPLSSSPSTCAGKADHGFGVCVPLALICLLKIVN